MQPDRLINNKEAGSVFREKKEEAGSDLKFVLAHNFVTRCCKTNNEIWKRRQVWLDAELRRLATQSEMSG